MKHHPGSVRRAPSNSDAGSPSSSDRCTRDAVRVADLIAPKIRLVHDVYAPELRNGFDAATKY